MVQYITNSADETRAIGFELGQALTQNSVVCFYGDLGAGKTTFIKGMAAGILGTSGEEICSPTFTYLNIYQGHSTLYHFDLYRLRDSDEFLSMGFDEYFDAGGVCCIEWAEKITPIEIDNALHISLAYMGEGIRSIEISSTNKKI